MKWWISFVLIICRLSASAQIDKEFYFAVPYVTPLHADRPVYLNFTSFNAPATIMVKFAYNNQIAYNISLPPFTSKRIDATTYLDIMSSAHGMVTDYGLYISSTTDITAYYEVNGSSSFAPGVNADIFVLKGKKALGTTFYIPVQTHWDNYAPVDAWTSFDIIASENNTQVTIYPTQDLLNHPAGTPFTVTLQRGQVYSARSLSNLGSLQPSGTKVVSNKPIAITLKHDSIIEGSNYDLAGDQLVPIDYIGSEYVAIKASGSGNYDRVFIIATEDNTDVFISGGTTAATTINEGQCFAYQLNQSAQYIQTSHPVYVFHIAGYGKELAGAMLPPIVCSGSKDVSFSRANSERFSLGLLVKDGGEDDFIINSNARLINPASFTPVPGLPGWKFSLIDFNTTDVPVNAASRIVNLTSDFQMAFMNGLANPTGFRYGIFSDYGGVELGADVFICPGQQTTLYAGYGKDTYLWSPSGDITQTTLGIDSGWYKVTVTKGTCQYHDSLYLGWYPVPIKPALGNDTMVCTGADPIVLSTLRSYYSYLWSTGSTQSSIQTSDSGAYTVLVKNIEGCSIKDTIHVGHWPLPVIAITPSLTGEAFCHDSLINLSVTPGYAQYKWYNGLTATNITVPHTYDDVYSVKATTTEGCSDSTNWSTDCSIYIGLIPNLLTANNDTINEVFFIEGLKNNKWSLEIYDRWGSRVYFNNAYQNNWDPRNIRADIYFYRLYHNTYDDLEYKGWVQVVH